MTQELRTSGGILREVTLGQMNKWAIPLEETYLSWFAPAHWLYPEEQNTKTWVLQSGCSLY